jgi:hypothetical protein
MKTAGAATADTLISRHPLVAQIAGGGDEALRFASGSVEFQLSATMPLSPADNADLTCGNQVVHLTSAARIIKMSLRYSPAWFGTLWADRTQCWERLSIRRISPGGTAGFFLYAMSGKQLHGCGCDVPREPDGPGM